ncbi:MAG: ABC transporter permease [Candidatus Tectomicrobia bacterium]|uniref:ABC transporter permease n=1 Tax=Tectimicrobiota bacterium TaxID=2528274 RepID=A0A937W0R3_UNCTE|nr:ABC transporter permease [Candidatus Tectomicrobia bacterium]
MDNSSRGSSMPLSLKLAIRNVFRNRRRTLITLATMAFGATAIVLFGGFVHFMFLSVRESAIHSQLGHIQLYKTGFSEKGSIAPFDYMIANYAEIRALIMQIPHVQDVMPRLGFSGLISTGETTTSFVGAGVHPESEAHLASFTQIVDGQDLSRHAPRGILLGLGLARGLGVRPGDELTLLTTTRAGAFNALAVQVRGIWQSGEKAYDDRMLKAPLPDIQRLLDNEGEVQSIVILLEKTEHTAAVKAQLATLLHEHHFDLEMRTWDDLAIRYHQVRQLFTNMFRVMTLIVSMVVTLGIANTMLMAIFERTREIGTIMALGTRRRGVITLFVMEGGVLGVLGGVLGIVLGIALAKLISAYGIPMPPPPGSNVALWPRSWSSPRSYGRLLRWPS